MCDTADVALDGWFIVDRVQIRLDWVFYVSLKSLMKDGTAVSLCRLVLQDGEDSLTPLGSHLK